MAHRKKGRRFDSPEQEVYLNLWRAYDRLKAIEDELFSQFGLSPQQYNALRLLQAVHPETLPTLAISARLVSRAPDITRLIDKLEQRGLVWRERRSDNRRVVDIGVTQAGLKLLEEMAEPVRDCHQRQLGHLSADELRQLADLLQAAREPHEDENGVWAAHR